MFVLLASHTPTVLSINNRQVSYIWCVCVVSRASKMYFIDFDMSVYISER